MHFVFQRSAIAESGLLVFVNQYCRAVAGGFAFALPNCDYGRVGIRVYVEAVISGLLHGERLVGRVHFVSLAVEIAHVEVHRALV